MSSLKWLLVGGLVILSSCGKPAAHVGDPTVDVSGSVTLDGKPLTWGQILFKDPAQDPPREYYGAIEGGQFQCQAPPGTLRVEIRADEQASLDEPARSLVPARYNDRSELKAELTPGAPAQLSFELESQ